MKKLFLYLTFIPFYSHLIGQIPIQYSYDLQNRLTQINYGDSLLINYSYDELGNRMSQAIEVNNSAAPTVSINPEGSLVLCEGDSLRLSTATTGSNLTYQWNTGASSEMIVVSRQGSYSVSVTDDRGRSTADSLEVTIAFRDSTEIDVFVCDMQDHGTDIEMLTNKDGCDSLVFTNKIFADSQIDFSMVQTCERSAVGSDTTFLTNLAGCDSLIIVESVFAGSDTTRLSGTTCEFSQSGITYQNLSNQNGCDSIVEFTNSYIPGDVVERTVPVCSADSVGTVTEYFVNQFGCDSVVNFIRVHTPLAPVLVVKNICEGESYEGYNATGSYTDEFVTAEGCDSTRRLELSVSPRPNVQAIYVTNAYCGEPGEIRISASISGPSDITWANGEIGSFRDELLPGDYPVTITNGFSCDLDTIITVFGSDAMTVDFGKTDVSCFNANDGVITANISGGEPSYVYNWTGQSSNNQTLSNLSPGIFELYATDCCGCSVTKSIEIFEPSALTFEVETSNQGNTVRIVPQGGTAPYSVLWSNDSTSFSLNNLPAGNYTVTLTDANGCTFEKDFNLTSGLSEIKSLMYFAAYPNPADQVLFVEATFDAFESGNINFYDVAGKKLFFRKFEGKSVNEKLDVSSVIPGIYSVEIRTVSGKAVKRVFVVR